MMTNNLKGLVTQGSIWGAEAVHRGSGVGEGGVWRGWGGSGVAEEEKAWLWGFSRPFPLAEEVQSVWDLYCDGWVNGRH